MISKFLHGEKTWTLRIQIGRVSETVRVTYGKKIDMKMHSYTELKLG